MRVGPFAVCLEAMKRPAAWPAANLQKGRVGGVHYKNEFERFEQEGSPGAIIKVWQLMKYEPCSSEARRV